MNEQKQNIISSFPYNVAQNKFYLKKKNQTIRFCIYIGMYFESKKGKKRKNLE